MTWVRRTGLPGPLADVYASADESEEEDEADEDSNGTLQYFLDSITYNKRPLGLLSGGVLQK